MIIKCNKCNKKFNLDDRLITKVAARFEDLDSFKQYALEKRLDTLFQNTMESLDIKLIAPGGFDSLFQEMPLSSGLRLPVLQSSIGLPLYTQLTFRALPEIQISSIGTVQYAGLGAKCNISHLISKLLNLDPRYRKELDIFS